MSEQNPMSDKETPNLQWPALPLQLSQSEASAFGIQSSLLSQPFYYKIFPSSPHHPKALHHHTKPFVHSYHPVNSPPLLWKNSRRVQFFRKCCLSSTLRSPPFSIKTSLWKKQNTAEDIWLREKRRALIRGQDGIKCCCHSLSVWLWAHDSWPCGRHLPEPCSALCTSACPES